MYKRAREKAEMSMEEASFRLHIGRRTLANYEKGITPVPCEIVSKMAEVYISPELLADHCAKKCPVGQLIAQELQKKDIALSVLGFLKEFEDVNRRKNNLVEIAADGKIDEKEKSEFIEIIREIRDLDRSIGEIEQMSMRLFGINTFKKEKTTAEAVAR